jgi:IclR family KDG regulon transcriptional repressor
VALLKNRSKTVEHALDVLEAFRSAPQLGVGDVARRLRLSKTVVHRLLASLEARGYVRQDPVSQKYALTLKLWQIGVVAMRRVDLPSVARDVLESLVRETGQTAYVSVLDGVDVVWIAKVEGREPLRVYVEVGGHAPGYCTASGKALLAHASDEMRSRMFSSRLEKLTRRTITDPRDFEREFKTIRSTGLSINVGERQEDIGALAAPVFDHADLVIAAVGISGPLTRMPKARLPQLGAAVQRAAGSLSGRIGHRASIRPSAGQAVRRGSNGTEYRASGPRAAEERSRGHAS